MRRLGRAAVVALVVTACVAALGPVAAARATPRRERRRCSSATKSSGTTVVTDRGAVRGTASAGVTDWLDIPFAAPPVGPLRWAAPELPACWKGVRSTQAFGPPCPQLDNGTVDRERRLLVAERVEAGHREGDRAACGHGLRPRWWEPTGLGVERRLRA